MPNPSNQFGPNLASARAWERLSQEGLAQRAGLSRLSIVRFENGLQIPKWDEAVQLATALKIPLEYFLSGQFRPHRDLSAISFELYQLGIVDLEISGAKAPGAFRNREEVLAIALQGNRPEPSVVDAIPAVLARWSWHAPLLTAIAEVDDARVKTRAAWLADITLVLGRRTDFPFPLAATGDLEAIVRTGVRAAEPDSLGHPDPTNQSPIWKRWNITYAADANTFLRRAQDLAAS